MNHLEKHIIQIHANIDLLQVSVTFFEIVSVSFNQFKVKTNKILWKSWFLYQHPVSSCYAIKKN